MMIFKGTKDRSPWVCPVLTRLGFSVLAMGLMFQGCGIPTSGPQVPTTDWSLGIPLADEKTTIEEVVEGRGDFLFLDPSDKSMSLSITQAIDNTFAIGDRLKISLPDMDFDTPMAEIRTAGQKLPDFNFPMSKLLGQDQFDQLAALGTVPLAPATEIDQIAEVSLADTDELVVRNGGIEVTITNGLPVPLELELFLYDRDNGDRVVTVMTGLPDQIAPNSQESGIFDLSDKTISGNLAIAIEGTTVETENVEIVGDPELIIESVVQSFIVERAVAKVEPLALSDNRKIPFPDDRIVIQSAEIDKGGMVLKVTNQIPVDMKVFLQLDDLTKGGEPVVIELPILSPQEEEIETVNLDGTAFVPDPADPLNLRLSYSAVTEASDGPVSIDSKGTAISVEVQTEDLKFGKITGTLDQLELVKVDPIVQEINNIPEGLEEIEVESTSLAAWLTSKVGFQSEIELLVKGSNAIGEEYEFTVVETFERYNRDEDPESGKIIKLALDATNVTDFLNLLPNKISVTPRVKVGDGVGTEVVSPGDWVRVDSVIFGSMPRFEITADDAMELEPNEHTIGDPDDPEDEMEKWRQKIYKNLEQSELDSVMTVYTIIENHIPLDVGVRVYVGAEKETVYTDPLFIVQNEKGEPFGVEAGAVDDEGRTLSGKAGSKVSSQEIGISTEDALHLVRPGGFYTGIKVEFKETDGTVEVLGSDWISIKAATEITLELNEALLKKD